MPPSSVDAEDIKRAHNRLVGLGLRPPWERADGPTRPEVARQWRDACDRHRVDGRTLLAAVDTWGEVPAEGGRWWPAPADVLAHARREAEDTIPGCGRCTANGHASIAVHYDDRVERWWACCTCSRGIAALSRHRGDKGSGAIDVAELATRYRARDGVRAVYLHPSPGQRRLDLVEPELRPTSEATARRIIDDVRAARGFAPAPEDRY